MKKVKTTLSRKIFNARERKKELEREREIRNKKPSNAGSTRGSTIKENGNIMKAKLKGNLERMRENGENEREKETRRLMIRNN